MRAAAAGTPTTKQNSRQNFKRTVIDALNHKQRRQRDQRRRAVRKALEKKARAPATVYSTEELQAVLVLLVTSRGKDIARVVRGFNDGLAVGRRVPESSVKTWWGKMKQLLTRQPDRGGVFDDGKVLDYINQNVKKNGDTGKHKRRMTDAEEEVVEQYVTNFMERGVALPACEEKAEAKEREEEEKEAGRVEKAKAREVKAKEKEKMAEEKAEAKEKKFTDLVLSVGVQVSVLNNLLGEGAENADATSKPKLAAEKITRKTVLDLQKNLDKEGMPTQLVKGSLAAAKVLVKRVLNQVLLAPVPQVRRVAGAAVGGAGAA